MMKTILRLLFALALSIPFPLWGGMGRGWTGTLSAQSLVFRAPVDYDYDHMKGVSIADGQYWVGKARGKRFRADKGTTAQPLDGGGEFAFAARLVDHGDRAITTPTNAALHQRESFLYTHADRVLLGQAIIREEARERLDTAYMMSFKVRRQMSQPGLPANHDGPFELELDLAPDSTATLSTVGLASTAGDTLAIALDHRAHTLTLTAGGARSTMSVAEAADPDLDGLWHLSIIVSRTTAEVFVNEGRRVMSRTIGPAAPFSALLLRSEGGKTKFSAITVYRRKANPLRI